MRPPEIAWQTYRGGGGRVLVRRPRGRWRVITFASGRTQMGKLLGLASVVDRVGGSTTVPLGPAAPACGQWAPPAVEAVPLLPRPGPVVLRT